MSASSSTAAHAALVHVDIDAQQGAGATATVSGAETSVVSMRSNIVRGISRTAIKNMKVINDKAQDHIELQSIILDVIEEWETAKAVSMSRGKSVSEAVTAGRQATAEKRKDTKKRKADEIEIEMDYQMDCNVIEKVVTCTETSGCLLVGQRSW